MWTLGLYALDRLIYVMYPLKYHTKMNRRKAMFMLLGIWVYSTALSLPPVFGYNKYKFSKNTYTCGIGNPEGSYFLLFCIGAFPIPLATICISYIVIYIIARENSRRVSSLCESLYDGSENLMKKAKSHIKSTAVVSAVIICSLICLLPVFIIGIYYAIAQPSEQEVEDRKFTNSC
ncbi:alpha-1A adrenergic receptor-like [Bolinopsis microptera]|uniref:alpha-1A adrenergic receptor-like n=1 Tax=Bolinopsis microptera TaxID=2820187 RepID=UPI00307AD8A3